MTGDGQLRPGWTVTDGSVEALFVRAFGAKISAHRPCLLELQALGLDPTKKLASSYSADVYERALLVLRKHLFADEPDDAKALWKMGRATSEGFYRTVIGGAIGAVMKLLPPARMLPRLPANITNTTNYMKSTCTQKAPQHWELYVFGSRQPQFIGGAVERGVEQTGTAVRVVISKSEGLETWLDVTW